MEVALITVWDLTPEEMSELKNSYFDQDETQDILPVDITNPEQIPDEIIQAHYDGMTFVKEDFFCNIEDGNYENCGAAYQ